MSRRPPMPRSTSTPPVQDLLADTPDPVAAAILAPAIRAAYPSEIKDLAVAATSRGGAALEALLERLGDLAPPPSDGRATRSDGDPSPDPPSPRDRAIRVLVARAPGLVHAARRVLAGPHRETVARELPGLLGHRTEPDVAVLLADLASAPGDPGRRASEVLLERWRQAGALPMPREAVDRLASGWSDERRSSTLFVLALAIEQRRGGLAMRSDGREHPATLALGTIGERLRDTPLEPLVRSRALRWLAHPVLGRSVRRRLHHWVEGGAIESLAAQGHHLRRPEARAALLGVLRPVRCLPGTRTFPETTPRAARTVVELAVGLGLTPRTIEGVLRRLAVHPDPIVRWRVADVLEQQPMRRMGPLAVQLTSDGCAAVAARAARTIDRATVREVRTRSRWERSSSRPLARAAARCAARGAPELEAWGAGARTEAAWRTACLAALERDRTTALDGLRAALRHGPEHIGLGCASIAARFGLVRALESDLAERLTDPEASPRLRAACATTLRFGRDGASISALVAACADPDGRVRADALLALAARWSPSAAMVRRAIRSDVARERAHAALVAVDVDRGRGAGLLAAMVLDERDDHRASAAWAIGRRRLVELLPVVERARDRGADPGGHGRLQEAAARLRPEVAA